MDITTRAALYLLHYQGLRGTPKQVASLLKNVGPFVLRMATERGFKPDGV